MSKQLKQLILISPAIFLIGCNNAGGSSSTVAPQNSINPQDFQKMLDDELNSKEGKDSHISGIPLTIQSKCINQNQPLSFATGKLGNNPDSPTLPKDAIFQIGSNSKSFLSVVALQLEHEGYFGAKGLDTTVGEVLGQNSYPKWSSITLRQLLNMTSGIPDYANDEAPDTPGSTGNQYFNNPYYIFNTDEILATVADKNLLFTPGESWHYSNTDYALMGKIIGYVTGVSIKEQITNRIIKPLNLTHTYYVENIPEDAVTNIAQKELLMDGYFYNPNFKPINQYFYYGVDIKGYSLSLANAAGSIISDTYDLNKFENTLFTTNKLLNAAEFKELTTVVADQNEGQYKPGQLITTQLDATVNRGYGLGIGEVYLPLPNGKHMTVYSHSGGTIGFSSIWMVSTDGLTSFATTINVINASQTINNIANNTLNMLQGCK